MQPPTKPLALPHVADRKPYYNELKAGNSYLWCRCGLSKTQPFCDGAHAGTGLRPVRYIARQEGEEVLFCGCKQTGTPPFCDGAHTNLPGGYREQEEASAGKLVPWVTADPLGISRLESPCYAVTPAATFPEDRPQWWVRTLVAPALGAKHQSQFYAQLSGGASPIISAGGCEAIIGVMDGSGAVDIAGHVVKVQRSDGVLIRAGETFQFINHQDQPLKVFVSVTPAIDSLQFLSLHSSAFDASCKERVARVDENKRRAMGPRFFQLLVDKRRGADSGTQFIGHIPLSRAELHRHLYEEALIILSGSGVIWNEEKRALVSAGDVIFFPRKHRHTLQCTDPNGMDVMGVICPGDNPGINY